MTQSPDGLYFTDNGAVYCGAHLGATAQATGRDISGQKIKRVSLYDVREWRTMTPALPDPCCEQCKKPFVGAEVTLLLADEADVL